MSIQKISQNELLSLGVSALPNRPSAPSLYSGRTLSATELKEAFDRLPTLIAERFNALLSATGLFDSENPKESLAELIATKHAPYHSLADFFADVENGNLALYFSVDGKDSLADVLAEMREDLLSLKSRSFSVEGDGDILTDATIEGPFITLQKGIKSTDILSEAKAYADSPTGIAEAGCALPVSGNEVARMISVRCAPEETKERLSRLEAASEGILYNYPMVDTVNESFLVPKHTLSNGALCRLGGTLIPQKNLFPEKILSTYHGTNLSISWDNEENCLVFDGTITPEDSPITLAPFGGEAEYTYYHAAIFTRGGNKLKTGSGNVNLRFYTEDNKYISLNLNETDNINEGTLLRTNNTKFNRIVIESTATIQFNGYKCNFLLQKGKCEKPVYVPFENEVFPSAIPQSISIEGPNLWEGEYQLSGLGGVTFIPNKAITEGSYIVSLSAVSDGISTNCFTIAHLENGRTIKRQFKKGVRNEGYFDFDSPLVFFRVLPESTEEASAPYTIHVKDFQVERDTEDKPFSSAFSVPCFQTRSLPASFSRFASLFLGFGDATCNYLDFEQGMFVKKVARYRLNDTLSFASDPNVAGRFHASASLPADLVACKNYLPTSVLFAQTEKNVYDECVWFTDDGIFLQSALFSSPEDISAFLSIHPIDILFETPEQREYLNEDEAEFSKAPIIPLIADARITIHDANGTPTPCFVRMQYQIHNLPEEETL